MLLVCCVRFVVFVLMSVLFVFGVYSSYLSLLYYVDALPHLSDVYSMYVCIEFSAYYLSSLSCVHSLSS